MLRIAARGPSRDAMRRRESDRSTTTQVMSLCASTSSRTRTMSPRLQRPLHALLDRLSRSAGCGSRSTAAPSTGSPPAPGSSPTACLAPAWRTLSVLAPRRPRRTTALPPSGSVLSSERLRERRERGGRVPVDRRALERLGENLSTASTPQALATVVSQCRRAAARARPRIRRGCRPSSGSARSSIASTVGPR